MFTVSYNSRTDKNTCNVYNYNARTSTNEFQKHNVYSYNARTSKINSKSKKQKHNVHSSTIYHLQFILRYSSSLYSYCRARILVGQLVQHKNNETNAHNSHILPCCYHNYDFGMLQAQYSRMQTFLSCLFLPFPTGVFGKGHNSCFSKHSVRWRRI